MEFLVVPLNIFLIVVAPIWIIAHYVTRWRGSKTLSEEDQKLLSELWEFLPKFESRIVNLERILDAEAPDWRTKT